MPAHRGDQLHWWAGILLLFGNERQQYKKDICNTVMLSDVPCD